MTERIIITGASGFIGANISRYLSSNGFQVYGVVRETSNLWRLHDLPPSFHIIKSRTYDTDSLKKTLSVIEPDAVVNAVGADQKETIGNPEENWKSNFLTLVSLTNAMSSVSAKLIHLGSSFEYGKASSSKIRLNEETPCEPVSEYGIVKLLQTEYLKHVSLMHELTTIVFRIFNVFGPYESDSRLIPQLILKSIRNEKITLLNPDVVRDFIYVDDVSIAIMKAINYTSPLNFEIFNLGTEIGTKVINIAKYVSLIKDALHSEIDIQSGDKRPENNLYGLIADISKAEEKLKWSPTVSLLDGLKIDYNWFLNNVKLY